MSAGFIQNNNIPNNAQLHDNEDPKKISKKDYDYAFNTLAHFLYEQYRKLKQSQATNQQIEKTLSQNVNIIKGD